MATIHENFTKMNLLTIATSKTLNSSTILYYFYIEKKVWKELTKTNEKKKRIQIKKHPSTLPSIYRQMLFDSSSITKLHDYDPDLGLLPLLSFYLILIYLL